MIQPMKCPCLIVALTPCGAWCYSPVSQSLDASGVEKQTNCGMGIWNAAATSCQILHEGGLPNPLPPCQHPESGRFLWTHAQREPNSRKYSFTDECAENIEAPPGPWLMFVQGACPLGVGHCGTYPGGRPGSTFGAQLAGRA